MPGVDGAELFVEDELSITAGVGKSIMCIIGMSFIERDVPMFGAQLSCLAVITIWVSSSLKCFGVSPQLFSLTRSLHSGCTEILQKYIFEKQN